MNEDFDNIKVQFQYIQYSQEIIQRIWTQILTFNKILLPLIKLIVCNQKERTINDKQYSIISFDSFYRQKKYNQMKQREALHTSCRILYNLKYFNVSQPKIDHILLSFKDESQQFQYTCTQEIKHVSYKTVVAALRGEQQNIVKAQFTKLSNEEYDLKIKVCYEFLHDIQERFIFKRGEKLGQNQIKALKQQKKIVNVLTSLKQQLFNLTRLTAQSGKFNNVPKKIHQIYFKIPSSPTVISLSLNLHQLQSNLLNIQIYYIDSPTKLKIPTNMLPKQDIFVVSNIMELSIIADSRDFPSGCITIQGDLCGCDYMITYQAASLSNPINKSQIFKWILVVSISLFFSYIYFKYLANSRLEEV